MAGRRRLVLSVKVVVRDQSGRCLLLRRSGRSRRNARKWDFPGGKVDVGESLEEAVTRELDEETGLQVSIERLAGATQSEREDALWVYLILEGRFIAGQVTLSDEHDDFAWVDPRELPRVDFASQFARFAQDYGSRGEL